MERILLDKGTDTDQVRSVLGLTEKDLSDKDFDVPSVELELIMALTEDGIDYTTVISEGTGASPSADQTKRYNYLRLYSIYSCAVILIPRLRLAAVQKIGDGDNSMERFTKPQFEKLQKSYESKVESFRIALQSAISGSATQTTINSPLSGVPPTYDPVVG